MAHPEPPADLATRPVVFHTTRKGQAWWRIHRLAHAPLHFGTTPRSRFDAPAGEFGVLYVGADAHCAFIETFGHATGTRFVAEAELAARALAVIVSTEPITLVDLRGEGLARIGADAVLTSGFDYPLSRRWARALHDHPRKPDGILYRARHDPARTSAALFNQVRDRLAVETQGPLSGARHARLLGGILDTYRFALV